MVSGTVASDIGYAGYFTHAVSGLDFAMYRAYDPAHARWLNRDPIGEAGGVNLYEYVGGNPGTFADPLGLCAANPTATHCLFVAAARKGASIGLDILGAIPAVGNVASAASAIARAGIAVNHVVTSPAASLASGAYGAYGAVTAGPAEVTDSIVGGASASAGIATTLADVSLGGTKALPILGNALSAATGVWDAYQAYKIYLSCMAGDESQ